MKEKVAEEIARIIENDQVIGVGTGTTVDAAVDAIARRISADKLRIRAVPTSYQSAWRCENAGMTVMYPGYAGEIAIAFDGADAIDEQGLVVKGIGGAMLKEKILAARARQYFIIAVESKLMKTIGNGVPIPIEVVPDARFLVERALTNMNATSVRLRTGSGKHGPVVTEAGNIILDAEFAHLTAEHESRLKSITGVVETGIFAGYADSILVATKEGIKTLSVTRTRTANHS